MICVAPLFTGKFYIFQAVAGNADLLQNLAAVLIAFRFCSIAASAGMDR